MTEPTDTPAPEAAEGRDITIEFDGSKCIHARFCVLQAPAVFRANTAGTWIDPDAMEASALAAVARNCPSGAIQYRARDLRSAEGWPLVNLVRIRENGPYAVHARIRLPGEPAETARRTLCRCGASRHKPYCDGSHATIGFTATGEPPSDDAPALEVRAGPLEIVPMRDGPLEVRGPVEMVSGTGRTVTRSRHCLLCRCGGSESKPFCDGSHARNGFADAPGFQPPQPPRPAIPVPSLSEWAGGPAALRALTVAFYRKVPDEPLLAPLFAGMSREHAEHVADFIAEVFGGPPVYTGSGGSHVGMIVKHLGRRIEERQRARWVEIMMETAAEVGLPADPSFRTAFEAYLEWGSKLAVINSADGIAAPEGEWPMPRWGWGAARGPGGARTGGEPDEGAQ